MKVKKTNCSDAKQDWNEHQQHQLQVVHVKAAEQGLIYSQVTGDLLEDSYQL
jgi:hypothetical protein